MRGSDLNRLIFRQVRATHRGDDVGLRHHRARVLGLWLPVVRSRDRIADAVEGERCGRWLGRGQYIMRRVGAEVVMRWIAAPRNVMPVQRGGMRGEIAGDMRMVACLVRIMAEDMVKLKVVEEQERLPFYMFALQC